MRQIVVVGCVGFMVGLRLDLCDNDVIATLQDLSREQKGSPMQHPPTTIPRTGTSLAMDDPGGSVRLGVHSSSSMARSSNVALPTFVRELGATTSQLQWIVDAYVLVFAGLLMAARQHR